VIFAEASEYQCGVFELEGGKTHLSVFKPPRLGHRVACKKKVDGAISWLCAVQIAIEGVKVSNLCQLKGVV
jgi:hypothetical protein